MKKVLVFGTFDILHKGHEYFLHEAKKLGELTVVIARDKTVEEVKQKKPLNNQEVRLKSMQGLGIGDKVVLGQIGDKYKIIEEVSPDIICLGYDQEVFTGGLKEELLKRKISAKIIRMSGFKPDKYKSSILRKKFLRKNK